MDAFPLLISVRNPGLTPDPPFVDFPFPRVSTFPITGRYFRRISGDTPRGIPFDVSVPTISPNISLTSSPPFQEFPLLL